MESPDWHPEDVKAAIRKTGVTLKALSLRWGYHESSVRAALRRPWPAVETLIATHLHRKPWTIWPSRYDQFCKPHYTRRPRPDRRTISYRNARIVT